MEKNYYELLEVDKNASPEVMEKAYKTLAKRYHPDLQPDDKKSESEEIFKKISEAYETLSDEKKRNAYNKTLISSYVQIDIFNKLQDENNYLKKQLNNYIIRQPPNHNSTFSDNNDSINNNSQKNTTKDYYYKDSKNFIKLLLNFFIDLLKQLLKDPFFIKLLTILIALFLFFVILKLY